MEEISPEVLMKKVVIMSFIILFAFACSSAVAKAEIKLESMVCDMCAYTIENEISEHVSYTHLNLTTILLV